MKHFTGKELLTIAQEKTEEGEKHLKECSSCRMKYNFLSVETGVKSYMKYEKARGEKKGGPCLSSEELKNYREGAVAKEEKGRIESHLICCEKCAGIYFNLADRVNVKSLWQSVEDKLSETAGWINGIFLVPDLLVSRKKREGEGEKVFVGDEVKLEIPVSKDGYLTVIHKDEKKISLVFPNPGEEDSSVKEGNVKIINGKIDPPSGTHYIKVFITEEKLLEPENIDFEDERSVMEEIQAFIKKLEKLPESKWSEEDKIYEVMEFEG